MYEKFDEEYFEHLQDKIREICASEQKFYQKITDIYATAADHSKEIIKPSKISKISKHPITRELIAEQYCFW